MARVLFKNLVNVVIGNELPKVLLDVTSDYKDN